MRTGMTRTSRRERGVDDFQPDVIVRLIEPPAAFRVAGVEPLASDHRKKHAALGQA